MTAQMDSPPKEFMKEATADLSSHGSVCDVPGLVTVVLSLDVSDGLPVTLGCQGAAVVTCKVTTSDYHIDSQHFVGSCVFFVPKRMKSVAVCETELAVVKSERTEVPEQNGKQQMILEVVTKADIARRISLPCRSDVCGNVETTVPSDAADDTKVKDETEKPLPAVKTEVRELHRVQKVKDRPRLMRVTKPAQASQQSKALGFVRYSRVAGKHESLRRLREEKYKGWYVYHPDSNSWMCTECKDVRQSETAMRSHVHHSHFERDPVGAETSSSSKTSHSSGLHHSKTIRSLQRVRTIVCDMCGHVMKSSCISACKALLKTHKVTQHGIDSGESHPCPECSKVYQTALLLRQHTKGVHRNPRVQCPVEGCSAVMKLSRLNHHKKLVHLGKVETHICHLCGREFRTADSLRKHIYETRAHGAERKHICKWPGCGKAFLTSKHLQVHSRLHTEEKPFQCERCGFRARQRTSLVYHCKKHHGEQSDVRAADHTRPVKTVDAQPSKCNP